MKKLKAINYVIRLMGSVYLGLTRDYEIYYEPNIAEAHKFGSEEEATQFLLNNDCHHNSIHDIYEIVKIMIVVESD